MARSVTTTVSILAPVWSIPSTVWESRDPTPSGRLCARPGYGNRGCAVAEIRWDLAEERDRLIEAGLSAEMRGVHYEMTAYCQSRGGTT